MRDVKASSLKWSGVERDEGGICVWGLCAGESGYIKVGSRALGERGCECGS